MSLTEIKAKIQESKRSSRLTLSGFNLSAIPPSVFALKSLYRLDLSLNSISEIPDSIGNLTNLRQLWANENPLTRLSPSIANCKHLTTLELSCTLIAKLPKELVKLPKLVEINLDGCPLNPSLESIYKQGFNPLWEDLQRKLDRRFYREEVFKRLKDTVYPGESPYALMDTTLEVFQHFKDLSSPQLKLFLHNLRRVFPDRLCLAEPHTIRSNFNRIASGLRI